MQIGKSKIADKAHRIMKKILVIRLSSLGDVVLTTPILYAMRKKAGVEVHLLTKPKMGDLLHGGEAADKFYNLGEAGLTAQLRAEKYDGILDLHCNFRSYWVRFVLLLTFSVGYKKTFDAMVVREDKIASFKVSHVQERYLEAAQNLVKKLGGEKFEINDWATGLLEHPRNCEDTKAPVQDPKASLKDSAGNQDILLTNSPLNYGVAILGGTYETKKMPKSVWIDVFQQDNRKWYLIGGNNEKGLAGSWWRSLLIN